MIDDEERLEGFDEALSAFLNAEATAASLVEWNVRADLDDAWEVALWLDGEYAGTWKITREGHEQLADDD